MLEFSSIMLTSDAFDYFKGDKNAVADKLGISVRAVYQWGERVPLMSAYKLEKFTRGKLKVDLSLYEGWNNQKNKGAA